MVPLKRNESCGTSVMRERSTFNDSVDMSTASTLIRPACSGAMRNNEAIIDDLPAPVRPAMPILSRGEV